MEKNYRLKTPFGTTISPYKAYAKGIEINTRKLKERYPFKEEIDLANLLEELENDFETATLIIEEENFSKNSSKEEKEV